MANSIRFALSLNPIEDQELYGDLLGYEGADRGRRARMLMRLGVYALQSSNGSANTQPAHSVLPATPAPVTATKPMEKTAAALPDTFEAFDSLDLNMSDLKRNLVRDEVATV
jgi:hypothetical protein